MTTDTYEAFATLDVFCEALARIERIGSVRRLIFVVRDSNGERAVVAKLIVPAELMSEMAHMIAADSAASCLTFDRLPIDAVAH